MAILAFLLGAALIVAGFGCLWASLNLVPTEMGLLYGVCGVIMISCGVIVLAIAALIVRIDRLVAPPREMLAAPAPPPVETIPMAPAEPAPGASGPIPAAEAEADELNANRRGHLPTLREMEQAIVHPETPPYVIGRYGAGGAKYIVFSDGTIEAETDEGAFRFATMGEFKSYIANRKR